LFSDFSTKQFVFLYRGRRDGFNPINFHRQSDGHGNTLTVILITEGSIFDGFTSLILDNFNDTKYNDSLFTFVFTFKNTHNIAPYKFPLRANHKIHAIYCNTSFGPVLGNDMYTRLVCNTSNHTNNTQNFSLDL
jgi:hypothetical protein